jgi:hypothetical protein
MVKIFVKNIPNSGYFLGGKKFMFFMVWKITTEYLLMKVSTTARFNYTHWLKLHFYPGVIQVFSIHEGFTP